MIRIRYNITFILLVFKPPKAHKIKRENESITKIGRKINGKKNEQINDTIEIKNPMEGRK
jgi:hypothetical protein